MPVRGRRVDLSPRPRPCVLGVPGPWYRTLAAAIDPAILPATSTPFWRIAAGRDLPYGAVADECQRIGHRRARNASGPYPTIIRATQVKSIAPMRRWLFHVGDHLGGGCCRPSAQVQERVVFSSPSGLGFGAITEPKVNGRNGTRPGDRPGAILELRGIQGHHRGRWSLSRKYQVEEMGAVRKRPAAPSTSPLTSPPGPAPPAGHVTHLVARCRSSPARIRTSWAVGFG